ncbi:nuclear transport factor 2 family protein [Dactylosporangium sp. CA-092794]|uniref:nuclear transport factor 2 family protein n=1 Tax=Dactylosporangium sp. CA-092794 TaxID=3239929 RepID=UPI003D8DBD1F
MTEPPQAWAHRTGKVSLQPLRPADWSPEALAARAQIAEAFYRFGMGHDEHRADVAASCFTEDVVYEVALGSAEPITSWHGRGEVEKGLSAVAGELPGQRRHLVSNIVVEELDLVAGTANALAYGQVSVAADGLFLGASVIYTARARREPDGCWRFDYFFIGMDHFTGTRPDLETKP